MYLLIVGTIDQAHDHHGQPPKAYIFTISIDLLTEGWCAERGDEIEGILLGNLWLLDVHPWKEGRSDASIYLYSGGGHEMCLLTEENLDKGGATKS